MVSGVWGVRVEASGLIWVLDLGVGHEMVDGVPLVWDAAARSVRVVHEVGRGGGTVPGAGRSIWMIGGRLHGHTGGWGSGYAAVCMVSSRLGSR